MSHSGRFSYPLICFLLFLTISTSFLAAAPVSAQAPTPTPVPTLIPTEEVLPPSDLFVQLPAAAPRLPAYKPVVLDFIKMTDIDNGWALSGVSVLTTYNGGLSWREVTPPESIPEGSTAIPYAFFLNRDTAWVIYSIDAQITSESTVWVTMDGGKHWTAGMAINQQVFGDKLWAEFFALDSHNVWLMVRGVIEETGSNYTHALFRSTDGGFTWTYLPYDSSENYTGMSFSDINFGVRTIKSAEPYDEQPPAYEMTIDGGVTWEKHELPAPIDEPDLFKQFAYCETYQPVALSFPSFRLLMGCTDNLSPHKLFEGFFYSSKNGGNTWLSYKLPAKARADTGQLVYFSDKKLYLLDKRSYYSINDGMKWADLKVVNWDGQFSFVDPVHGWAIARLQKAVSLVKTTNKAYTWKIIVPMVVR